MQAIELAGYNGIDSLRVIDVEKPRPAAHEVVIEVKAAGVNFAELELTEGRYESRRLLRSSWDLKRRVSSSKLVRR